MAINKTGAIFKGLTFDGESCKDYGIHITGEAVYNAPEREVEMVTIPGRNGQFALDMGRFENIEVTYPAGLFASTESDFSEAISDFRNLLCSKRGYVKLQDDYNPNEYRMAVYKSGLELEPLQNKAGEFEITFDCKPQRYLTSGETENTVANNGTLTNPTLFDAEPLLKVEGYGTVGFNGYEINITNDALGETSLDVNSDNSISIAQNLLNQGDVITFGTLKSSFVYQYPPAGPIVSNTFAITSDTFGSAVVATGQVSGGAALGVALSLDGFSTTYENKTLTATVSGKVTHASSYVSGTITATLTMNIDTNAGLITISQSINEGGVPKNGTVSVNNVSAYSTVSALGHPTYIDCELGEAYMMKGDSFVSLNHLIDLGSDLPKLAPGTNTFTKDNTITELKVISRWWKV